MGIDHDDSTGGGQAHALCRLAGVLENALADAVETPAWSMSPDEQRSALTALSRARSRLAEISLRVLAAGDRSDIGAGEASSSTGAWLAHHTGATRPAAHAEVKLANALDGEFAATREALAAGRILVEQARVIVKAVQALPEDEVTAADRARAEAHLLDLAGEHDAIGLKHLGRHLFEVIAPETADRLLGEKLAEQEAQARRKTFLEMHENDDGTTTGRFKIPDLHAHMLRKAIEAFLSPRRLKADERLDPDGRKLTRPELLGKGLCEFIERYPFEQIGKHAGMNATVVVTIDLESLLSGLGYATLDTGAKISAGEARRLACEAGLIPMVLNSESMPLDVGRRCRLHTEAQRLAISLRDQTCRAVGCDRLSGFCEFHHVVPWAQDGITSVASGAMLCSWHHHRIHDPRYDHTRAPDGHINFHRRQ